MVRGNKMELDSTTIKLSKKTKKRLDGLREYKRESYEELLEKMLEIMNLCRANPAQARIKLIKIDKQNKEKFSNNENKSTREEFSTRSYNPRPSSAIR